MKNTILIYALALLTLQNCCSHDKITPGKVATVETKFVQDPIETQASGGGNITSDGGSPVTARGVCWSLKISPTTSDSKTSDGAGTGAFISTLTNLTAGTKYFVRAYGVNTAGTGYGNSLSFFTTSESITDIEGNTYFTIHIGDQMWTTQNLRTTKYNDGTDIANLTTASAWSTATTGAYC